jgi:hypothetical protein
MRFASRPSVRYEVAEIGQDFRWLHCNLASGLRHNQSRREAGDAREQRDSADEEARAGGDEACNS